MRAELALEAPTATTFTRSGPPCLRTTFATHWAALGIWKVDFFPGPNKLISPPPHHGHNLGLEAQRIPGYLPRGRFHVVRFGFKSCCFFLDPAQGPLVSLHARMMRKGVAGEGERVLKSLLGTAVPAVLSTENMLKRARRHRHPASIIKSQSCPLGP